MKEDKDKKFEKKPLRKVQVEALSWYSRREVQDAIFSFCKNRETIGNFNQEFFAKRPDVLDYPSDIPSLVKKGVTSFHCSEEIWKNPMDINTDMSAEKYNEIREGWDFLIDIDSKYLDYSKIAGNLILKALEYNGVKNVGVKFSGSKGFHILVPWNAFPKVVAGELTKNHFPDWPRLIAGYIDDMIHDKLAEEILKLEGKQEEMYEVICSSTGESAAEEKISKYVCQNCGASMESRKAIKKTLRCNVCNYDMDKVDEDFVYVCPSSGITSKTHPDEFEKRATAKELIDSVDIVLVASRHLFRAPYSLHEKTCLVSYVLSDEEKKNILNFNPQSADPLKVVIRDFNPGCEDGEGKELLQQALDWAKKNEDKVKKFEGDSIDIKGLTITEDMFPGVIKKLLEGMKGDGRKRGLSLLLSFYSALEMPKEYMEEKILEWNKKNYKPLKEGYVRSQIDWYSKNKRLPPNYNKPIYKELGILSETDGLKNPISFTIRTAMRARGKSRGGKSKKKKVSRKGNENF